MEEFMGSYQEEVAFNVFFEAVPDALVVVDEAGKIVDVNAQLEKLFGYPREEMLGNPIEILVPATKRAMHIKSRQTYTENPITRYMGSRLTLTAAHKNGRSIPVDISLSPMYGTSDLYVIAAIRDISEIIRTQEETIQSWSRAMDFRDRETEKHAQRVAGLTVELATDIGLSPSEIAVARQGALLHDIGKIAIPDNILLKPGSLTETTTMSLTPAGTEEKKAVARSIPNRFRIRRKLREDTITMNPVMVAMLPPHPALRASTSGVKELPRVTPRTDSMTRRMRMGRSSGLPLMANTVVASMAPSIQGSGMLRR